MSYSAADTPRIVGLELPAVVGVDRTQGSIRIFHQIASARKIQGRAICLSARRGNCNGLRFTPDDQSPAILVGEFAAEDLLTDSPFRLQPNKFHIENNVIVIRDSRAWVKHPQLPPAGEFTCPSAVLNSWVGGITFSAEVRNDDDRIVRPGMRPPQIGALHAIASHWTVSNNAGLVVMPTGTGKTEVMLACAVMVRPKRLLVLVPSDALRTQTFDKFLRLGKLRELGVIPAGFLNPVVATIKGNLTEDGSLWFLESANVVISTVASLSNMAQPIRKKFVELFDHAFFDEAHHVPSTTWSQLFEDFESRSVLQFTATPFREDGKRMPGKILYNFPLRMAQEQKYFREIDFREVCESDPDIADEAVANEAVSTLRRDLAAGREHILLARTDTKEKADAILGIYERLCPDLNPVAVYSGKPGKTAIIRGICNLEHKVIVCVDMFGEGFDLPQLKIAALHVPHKSLAVTLQFCGRFTRDALNIGNATLVANIADLRVSESIEELYAEDSDWNKLIPKLSSKAIESQVDFSDFLEAMDRSDKGELFDLNVLWPKTSTLLFKAKQFKPRLFRTGIKKGTEVERQWVSNKKDLLVFITRSRIPIEWASVKEASNEQWDLYVLYFDENRGILFINSSSKGTLHQDLAKAVCGDNANLISGESMFRSLSGIRRLIFHSTGLYRKNSKLRFRMYTGLDIGEAIAPAAQIGNSKSNVFGVGYENGQRVTIGASHKGRVWAMSCSSIPDWQKWCERIADKITDDTIPTDEFLTHTLIPKEISSLPQKEFFCVAFPVEFYAAEAEDFEITAATRCVQFHGLSAGCLDIQTRTKALWEMESLDDPSTFQFCLEWGPEDGRFSVRQTAGDILQIKKGHQTLSLAAFFEENPPALFATDGSEVHGGRLLEANATQQLSFPTQSIVVVDWLGNGVDITKESKWKGGSVRPGSIQAKWIERLKNEGHDFVIDDDDAGEAADIITIDEDAGALRIHFYHCKYSGSKEPGVRVKDCYEVCGQAVRSTRWVNNPLRLLDHIQKRENGSSKGGRQTRLEQGTRRALTALARQAKKMRTSLHISIVQPGLSRGEFQPDISSILGAADSFIREFTGAAMGVFGSE